jgi:uncharacterized protein DUF4349
MQSQRSSALRRKHRLYWSGSFVLLILLLAGCGGSSMGSTTTASTIGSNSNGPVMAPPVQQSAAYSDANQKLAASDSNTNSNTSGSSTNSSTSSSSTQQQSPASNGPQYLIKTLKVGMIVTNTRSVASTIQAWITTTDPRSSTAGADYEEVGTNLYNVTLSFSVQASMYPQIYNYLRDYVPKQGGQLQSFTESVQDVTNDYVDTQSRLKTLRIELQRVQALLGSAQKLSDVLTLEQKLTDVEGQIETTEEHLNELTSQVTFYTVSISLQPTETAPAPPAPSGWSAGQVFHDAFAASLAFAQGLANFLIWLLAFSFYLVPVALIGWFVWRVRNRPRHAMPKPTHPSESDA